MSDQHYAENSIRLIGKVGRELTVALTNVLLVPRLKKNLCSLAKITSLAGTKVNLTAESVIIQKKGGIDVKLFSREESGNLYNMVCTRMEVKNHALFVKEKVDINVLHRLLGHPCYDYTKKTASMYGIKWEGMAEVYAGCATGKGRQKAMKKFTENRASITMERIFVDVSSLPNLSLGGSRYWILVVDDATRYKWSYFVST